MKTGIAFFATRCLTALWIAALCPQCLAFDPFVSKIKPPPTAELLSLLRGGGNVIYFRHGATPNYSDQGKVDLDDCSTQRNLSEEGRAQARAIGAAFARLKIPVGEVFASPYCRTADTARLAFGRVEKAADLFSLGQPQHPDDMARHELLRKRLATPPPAGTNTILVSHGSPLDAVAGEFLREGEAAVVRPAGDGSFRVIARVRAEAWKSMTSKHAAPRRGKK